MGDAAQIFVQIDVLGPARCEQLADRLTDTLLDRDVIAPFDTGKPGWHESLGRAV